MWTDTLMTIWHKTWTIFQTQRNPINMHEKRVKTEILAVIY